MKHAARRAAREFHISRVSRKQAIEVSPLKREGRGGGGGGGRGWIKAH